MKVIGFINQKGGVGKTTSTYAFASALARKNKRVLMIDLDPQGSLTKSTNCKLSSESIHAYHWLVKKINFYDVVTKIEENLDLIPTDLLLANAEMELTNTIGREQKLKKEIKKIEKNYDYIIIDSPPMLGNITINILTAVDEIIVPFIPEYLSLPGIKYLFETVEAVKENLNLNLKIAGFLVTKWDKRTNSSKEIVEMVKKFLNSKEIIVFNNKIRYAIATANAVSEGKSIYDFKKTASTEDYLNFVEEYLRRTTNV